ncbi:inositol polyphosphate-5-phosphatase, putative, partial [Entamoeba invadens IP1]
MDESNLNAPQDARKSILDPTALNIRVEDYTNPLSFNTPKPPSSRMGSQHTQRIFTTKGKVVFGMEVKRDKLVTTSPKSAGSCEMSQNSYLPCSSFLRSPTNSKRSATPVLSNLFFEYKNKQFDADLKKKKQTQQSVEMYKQLQQAGGQQAWKEQVRKSREVEIIYDEEKEEKSKELRTTLLQSPDKQIESSKPNMRQIKVQMFKNLEEQKTITFTSKTPIKLVYTPIAPEKWILDGKEPTREFISTNFELYGDIGLFLTYREKWYKTNILNELPYYAKVKEVTVLACTWNVNQCVYPREKIDRWTRWNTQNCCWRLSIERT